MANIDPPVKLVSLEDISIEQLEEYDTKIHIVNRRKWLEVFRNVEHSVAALIPDKTLVGYGSLYHTADITYKIGPVLADSPQLARVIIKELVDKLPDECRLMMLCLDENSDALDVMTKLGGTNPHRSEVLYTKYQLNLPVEKIFFIDNAGNLFA